MDTINKPASQSVPLGLQTQAAGGAQLPSKLPRKSRVILPPLHPDGHRLQIPMVYLGVEPRPVWACDGNPVFNEESAARLVGVSKDCLKKWRQRNKGPDYIQYGQGGPIRYELSALNAFRDANRVHVGSESD
jgi:hypothetical protein